MTSKWGNVEGIDNDEYVAEFIYLHDDYGIEDFYGDAIACVKSSGCIHFLYAHSGHFNQGEDDFQSAHNGENGTYIHICEIDKWINMLTSLKSKAKEHFGSEWK
jgi:hypothetical protein